MTTYQITVEPSGRQFAASADETIVAAAITAGVPLPYGCKDGLCGACKCHRVAGEVTLLGHAPQALSQKDVDEGFILSCRALPASDVTLHSPHVTSADAPPVRKLPVRVRALEKLAPDVMRLLLQLPPGEPLRYYAGQYVEFVLKDGQRRAYSIATPAHVQDSEPGLELHLRHMPGGVFTDQVFTSLKPRDILRIEGPLGSFYLRDDSDAAARPILFIASGTGFAPVKAMLEQLRHTGNTRSVALYWGARRPQDLYMHDWMLAAADELPWLRYVPVVSDALPEDGWTGRSGFVHQAVLDDVDDLGTFDVYACGAPAMVAAARESFTTTRGLPGERFFADAFTSAADRAAAA